MTVTQSFQDCNMYMNMMSPRPSSSCSSSSSLSSPSSSSMCSADPTDPSDPCCTTPEIISSLMALTGPPLTAPSNHMSGNDVTTSPTSEYSDASYCALQNANCGDMGRDYMYATATTPPSVQATRSQLIKEGLKLTIQSKRMASGQLLPQSNNDHHTLHCHYPDELTPEDEERRKRRRERNKVAATKCRNKKKERTVHLMIESEDLEHTNLNLKHEIQRLESEKQRLLGMLTYHLPACALQNPLSYYDHLTATV